MQRPNDSQALLIQIDRFFVTDDRDLANAAESTQGISLEKRIWI